MVVCTKFYDIIGVKPDAPRQQIKKAYHKLALKCHPDKNPDDPGAAKKFQELQGVASVLLDEDKRKEYDELGEVSEDGLSDLSGKGFDELYKYFRSKHAAVTESDVAEWAAKYPASEMEREDLRAHYDRFDGDMSRFTDYIPFGEAEDGCRVRAVIDGLIAAGELEATAAYKKFKPKVLSQAQVDRAKSKRHSKKAVGGGGAGGGGGGGAPADLMAMIAGNQAKRAAQSDAMFDALAAKYAKPAKKPKKKKKKKKN